MKPCILCILDGWGCAEDSPQNAILRAKTPAFSQFQDRYPSATLLTHGEHVGLPKGQAGNSEVGHMTIGAGRLIIQDLTRISSTLSNVKKDRHALPFLQRFRNAPCHIIGLLSRGGVHAHIDHILALCHLLNACGTKVLLHGILDGRDTQPCVSKEDIPAFLKQLPANTSLVTLSGRFFAMDRDNRWERTQKAFEAMAYGIGQHCSLEIALKQAQNTGDEFLHPCVLNPLYQGILDHEGLLMANFRTDRIKQLLKPLYQSNFQHFKRKHQPLLSRACSLSPLDDPNLTAITPLFPFQPPKNTLGHLLSQQNTQQLRLAETEKFPHVTFFFNGRQQDPFKGEHRLIIPSPSVPTYDLAPKMSAMAIATAAQKALNKKSFSFLLINFANPDMVGHTQNLNATIQAVQAVDQALNKIISAAHQHHASLIVTADHGNAEDLSTPAHSCSPVPIIIKHNLISSLKNGSLQDIAPTVLKIMNLNTPQEMTGTPLF